MTNYHIDLDSHGNGAIYVYESDNTHVIHADDPEFTSVFAQLREGKSWSEISTDLGVGSVERLSPRITLIDDVLHFDGAPVDNALTSAIKRYRAEGRDPIGLVNFMTKLHDASDSYRIRNFAFQWLTSQRLEVTPEGNLLGYRGVDENLRAVHKGSGAYVNGVWDEGIHGVMNAPGTVISLPRHEVSDDPSVACGPGLHVGSETYARGWGRRYLVVEVEPKDIVSVPLNEVNKMRVCAYKVVEEIIDEVPDYEAPMTEIWEDDILPVENQDTWRDRLRKVAGRVRGR